jgi:thiol-disulfide isomerase/thioredoxin
MPRWSVLLPIALVLSCGSARGGGPAPASFAVLDRAGLAAHLAPRPGDQAVLVNVWATWCGPCVGEMPELVELHHKYAQQGVRVVAVSIDLVLTQGVDSAEGVRSFAEQRGFALPVVVYEGDYDQLCDDFDLPGAVPVTWVVNARGEVVDKHVGQASLSDFEAMLAKAKGS